MAIESSDLIKGAVTGVIGLVGTLVTVGVSWVKDRDAAAQRLRGLELANERLTFWESWLKIQLSLEPTDAQKQAALQTVREQTAIAQYAIAEASDAGLRASVQGVQVRDSFTVMRESLPAWKRWLLFYKPGRPVAWISRVLFWIYAFEGLMLPFGLLDKTSADKLPGYQFAAAVVGVLALAWGLWAISRAVEKPKALAGGV